MGNLRSVFQNIPQKIMVFIERWKIVMAASMDPDQGNAAGIEPLQGFTMADGDQPVLCTMYNIGMASYLLNPQIRSEMVTQYNANGEYG